MNFLPRWPWSRSILAVGAVAAVVIIAALAACVTRPQSVAPVSPRLVSVIPAPLDVRIGTGAFKLRPATKVLMPEEPAAANAVAFFLGLAKLDPRLDLQVQAGAVVPAQSASNGGVIQFNLRPNAPGASAESYEIDVSSSGVRISAGTPAGLLYGGVTLWQLLTATGGSSLAALHIADAPRFQWRGLMLDSARHYQSPQFIEQFIDLMAVHKLNVLHWHLTDDQAWRLEIRKYPRLTEVGAWRVPAGRAPAGNIDSSTGKPRLYGGFYTQDDVRRIVAHAAARNITVIPEIEMPGHASAAIAAYPRLGVTDQPPQAVPADWGVYSNLYNVEDATFEFLQDVLTEVMTLFPGEYIHIGGDEAAKDQWKASPRVQARMREFGVKDEAQLQSYFVQRIGRFLSTHHRRLVGWDEILEGGLAPDATVMSWRGIEGAVAAARAGHDTVLSPAPTLYFDHRQSADDEQPGRGRVISLEDVYRFDPAPGDIPQEQHQHILGVQANIWTEHIRSEERVEYMTFPRAAAVAEIGWSSPQRIDWQSFVRRLGPQWNRYRALRVNYAPNALPSARKPMLATERHGSHQLRSCTDKLVLSLEDDAPINGPRKAFLVDIMNPCWILRQVDLSRVTSVVAAVGQVPFNFQLGQDIHKISVRKPATREGELEVRVDSCEGERIAVMSLASATQSDGVTVLPRTGIAARAGLHDLCLSFTQNQLDPLWVIDWVQVLE